MVHGIHEVSGTMEPAAVCRIMPFRPWVSCGEHRRDPGLVGILWGRPQGRSQPVRRNRDLLRDTQRRRTLTTCQQKTMTVAPMASRSEGSFRDRLGASRDRWRGAGGVGAPAPPSWPRSAPSTPGGLAGCLGVDPATASAVGIRTEDPAGGAEVRWEPGEVTSSARAPEADGAWCLCRRAPHGGETRRCPRSVLQGAHSYPTEYSLTCGYSFSRRVKSAFCPRGVHSSRICLVSATHLLDRVP